MIRDDDFVDKMLPRQSGELIDGAEDVISRNLRELVIAGYLYKAEAHAPQVTMQLNLFPEGQPHAAGADDDDISGIEAALIAPGCKIAPARARQAKKDCCKTN